MAEDIALVAINVGIWRRLAVLYPDPATNWRKYAFVLPVCLMNLMQFIFLLRMWGDLPAFILNLFFFSAIFNALMRTVLVMCKHLAFEKFLDQLTHLYRQIEASSDEHSRNLLALAVAESRRLAIFNLTASFLDILGALIFALFLEQRSKRIMFDRLSSFTVMNTPHLAHSPSLWHCLAGRGYATHTLLPDILCAAGAHTRCALYDVYAFCQSICGLCALWQGFAADIGPQVVTHRPAAGGGATLSNVDCLHTIAYYHCQVRTKPARYQVRCITH